MIRINGTLLAWLSASQVSLYPASAGDLEPVVHFVRIPAGSTLNIRLVAQTPSGSEGRTIGDTRLPAGEVIPAGTRVLGESASAVVFDTLVLSDGTRFPIAATTSAGAGQFVVRFKQPAQVAVQGGIL